MAHLEPSQQCKNYNTSNYKLVCVMVVIGIDPCDERSKANVNNLNAPYVMPCHSHYVLQNYPQPYIPI